MFFSWTTEKVIESGNLDCCVGKSIYNTFVADSFVIFVFHPYFVIKSYKLGSASPL